MTFFLATLNRFRTRIIRDQSSHFSDPQARRKHGFRRQVVDLVSAVDATTALRRLSDTRTLLLTRHLTEQVLPDLPHRQFVLAVPKAARKFFRLNADYVPIVGDRPDYYYQLVAAGGSLSYAASSILPFLWRGRIETLRRTQRIVDAGAILGIGVYAVTSSRYDGDDGILLGLWVGLPAMLHLLSTFIPTAAE